MNQDVDYLDMAWYNQIIYGGYLYGGYLYGVYLEVALWTEEWGV